MTPLEHINAARKVAAAKAEKERKFWEKYYKEKADMYNARNLKPNGSISNPPECAYQTET